MNNVYFPAQVVTLLRRLANVVSTISISNHYFQPNSDCSNRHSTLSSQHKPDWLSRFTDLREASVSAKELTLQWLNEKWLWRPFLLSSKADVSASNPSPLPRKDATEQTREKAQDPDVIHKLLQNPALCDPLRTPRYPLVLCHGLYGFDTRGPSSFPSLRMHYWANVLSILRDKLGAEVIVTSVPGTGFVSSRSESLDRQLHIRARGRGVNFLAHSMGGLDCRYLISRIKPTDYVPLSLTTISTPHRGSPFMDWCAEHLGLGRVQYKENSTNGTAAIEVPSKLRKDDMSSSLSLSSLPSSFTTLLLSILDSPAYANLTSSFLNDVFNPTTPDDSSVKYFSVAGRMSDVSVWHPFYLPKMILDDFEEEERSKSKAAWESSGGLDSRSPPLWAQDHEWGNDGLVTVQSAKWGEFLGIMEECDHWQMRGARGIEFGVDLPNIPSLSSDWSFRDWSRFTTFWSRETKPGDAETGRDRSLSSVSPVIRKKESLSPATASTERVREREQKLAQDDAVIKSSTDKLSAVMDWLTEQVPPTPKLSLSGAGEVSFSGLGNSVDRLKEKAEEKPGRKSELEAKKDLERFYVALCRKIYDEGL